MTKGQRERPTDMQRTKEIIVDEPGFKLWYHLDTKIIHHEMVKYPGTQILESGLQKGLEVLRQRRARKWLSDDRRGAALPKAHRDWAQKVWGPAAAAAGWKYWALLPPSGALGSANMARLVEIYAALGVTAQTFQSPRDAVAWLLGCP